MKNKILSNVMIFFAIVCIVIASGFSYSTLQKAWAVPDAAKNKKNGVPSNAESIAAGKALWSTHCKSCHGSKGLGDGPKAANLKTEAGDFSTAAFHAQTDGALFYKVSEGRDDMPGFKKKISDEDDRWSIVNYMKTFKK